MADHAEMIVDLRFNDNDEYLRVNEAIRSFSHRQFEPDVLTSVEQQAQTPVISPSAETEKLMKLVEKAGEAVDVEVRWQAVGGGSDANHTAALGVPSLDGFGPVGAGFHSPSEYLELNSIEPRVRLLREVIRSL